MGVIEDLFDDLLNLINVKGMASPTMILSKLRQIQTNLVSELDDVNTALGLRLIYKGTYDASLGVYPTPTDLSQGWYYVVSTAGLIGAVSFAVGDWMVYNGTTWDKVSAVSEVEGVFYCNTEAEINSALTAIGAGAGKIVIISGTITLSATININGGGSYIIEGMGDKSIIDCNGDRTAFAITAAESCVLRDFKIDATGLTTQTKIIIQANTNNVLTSNITIVGDGANGRGIYVTGDRIKVEKCDVSSVYNGIHIMSSAANCKIIGNMCYSNGNDGIFMSGSAISLNTISKNSCYSNTGYGIELDAPDYCIINENECYSNGIDGIHCVTGLYNTISENICYNNTNYGIQINSSNYNTFIGNNCHNNNCGFLLDTSDYNTVIGSNCRNNTNQGIYIVNSSNHNTISGNICSYNDDGISIDEDRNVISNNICRNNTNYGIYCNAINDCSINGNICNLSEYGIYVATSAVRCNISNNICGYNTIAGIYGTGIEDCVVNGNNCNYNANDDANPVAGILLQSVCDDNVVSGNMCRNNTNIGAGTGHGILINNANCDNNFLSGNRCTANDTDYTNSGTGTKDDIADTTVGANLNIFS